VLSSVFCGTKIILVVPALDICEILTGYRPIHFAIFDQYLETIPDKTNGP